MGSRIKKLTRRLKAIEAAARAVIAEQDRKLKYESNPALRYGAAWGELADLIKVLEE